MMTLDGNLVDPNLVKLTENVTHTIFPEVEESLMRTDPLDWTPILIKGERVIDGVQRVLVARKHKIPWLRYKVYHD